MVGVIGLGVEHLKKKPREEIVEVVREAVRLGVNYIDLIWSYPHVVEAVGEGIRDTREDVCIAVHLGSCYSGDKYVRSRSVKRCHDTFEEVLTNLNIGYVDVVNLHYLNRKDWDRVFKQGGVLDLAKQLVEEGKARTIGLSTHNIEMLDRASEIPDINSVMFQVNMANHRLLRRDEVFKKCIESGKGVVAMKVFGKGKLLKRRRKEKFASYMTGGEALTTSIPDESSSVKCLHYALSQSGVVTTVPGCSSVEELRDCLKYLCASDEEKNYRAVLEELFLNQI